MANDQDPESKTEEPSEKRLKEAREKGQVARSQEAKHAVAMGASLLAFSIFGMAFVAALSRIFNKYLGNAEAYILTPATMQHFSVGLVREYLSMVLPVMLVLVFAALAGGFVQGMPTWSYKKLAPDFSRLSLLKGLKRILGVQGVVELLKTVAKGAMVLGAILWVVWPYNARLQQALSYSIVDLSALIYAMSIKMIITLAVILVVLTAADYLWQKRQFMRQMRMTRQEVKDEHKQTEGDPFIKSRIRSIRMQRARKRMMAAVPESDVVITNPTHYAVALKYKHGETEVPLVIAKGAGEIALRIRDVAQENRIVIVENPPLARVLYAQVDMDNEIKPEHYKAVAEIISFVMQLQQGHNVAPPQPAHYLEDNKEEP